MTTRPILRWHGGKWRLADWIIAHLPSHRVYVEPFGGAASVLLKKPRSYCEVYNDLDGEVVNLFRVARTQGEQLRELLELTPFARDEFVLSYEHTDDPLEQARRTVVRSFMGFCSNSHNNVTGFRSNSSRRGTTPARDWLNYPLAFAATIERLQGALTESVQSQMDWADWLSWYAYINGMGSKGLEAGPKGATRPIRTLDDLLWLVELE